MLIGEYEHSLDTKGRMIMPAKLRQDIGEKFIITKGLDGCLFVFSQNEWLNFEEKLKALPLSDKNARNFVRFFLSGATECEIDKQGRFLILFPLLLLLHLFLVLLLLLSLLILEIFLAYLFHILLLLIRKI